MPEGGIEPPRVYGPPDFESGASTNFTTPANIAITTLVVAKYQLNSLLFATQDEN